MGCIKWKARAFKHSTLTGWLPMSDEYRNFINKQEKVKGKKEKTLFMLPTFQVPSSLVKEKKKKKV